MLCKFVFYQCFCIFAFLYWFFPCFFSHSVSSYFLFLIAVLWLHIEGTGSWWNKNLYVPEDAEDHNSRGERDEGNTVTDGVADLHLPEKLALQRKKKTPSKQVMVKKTERWLRAFFVFTNGLMYVYEYFFWTVSFSRLQSWFCAWRKRHADIKKAEGRTWICF